MITISRTKINPDQTVELSIDCELFGFKIVHDCQKFKSKESANRYWDSSCHNVLCYNIEKFLSITKDKFGEKDEWKRIYEWYKNSMEFFMDHKSLAKQVNDNAPDFIIIAQEEKSKELATKLLEFCLP